MQRKMIHLTQNLHRGLETIVPNRFEMKVAIALRRNQ